MDREMEFNTEVTKIHHTNYVRNSRAITVAWFVFCACYTILNVVAFIQPFWFGDTNESPGVGYFGLYEWCEKQQGSDYSCKGDFLDFNTITNDYFRATSFLVGGASLLFIFSIICMLLFLFLKATTVLQICGWLQLVAGVFMAVGCIIYPNSFDDDDVRRICGEDATAYNMDHCQIRWAYILAIVLIFDALILAALAFILAARQAKMIPEMKMKPKEAGMRYVYEWTDESYTKDNFPGSFVRETPSVIPSSVQHQRYLPPLESSNKKPSVEPLVIPVDDIGDSPNQTSRSEPLSQRSSSEAQDTVSETSPRFETSPRSESSLHSDAFPVFETSPRSNTSHQSGTTPRSETSPGSQKSEGSLRSRKSTASTKSGNSGHQGKTSDGDNSESEDIHL